MQSHFKFQQGKIEQKWRWRACDLLSSEPPFAVDIVLLFIPREASLPLLIMTMLVCDLFFLSLFFFRFFLQILNFCIRLESVFFFFWLLIFWFFFPLFGMLVFYSVYLEILIESVLEIEVKSNLDYKKKKIEFLNLRKKNL